MIMSLAMFMVALFRLTRKVKVLARLRVEVLEDWQFCADL